MTPLYATEAECAALILGRGRLREWRAFATIWERDGLPQIDPITGRRFMPAVVSWLYRRHGLEAPQPMKPDGAETWPEKTGYAGAAAPMANVVPIGSRGVT